MKASREVLLGAFVVTLLVVALLGYEVILGSATTSRTSTTQPSSTSSTTSTSLASTGSETTTSNTTAVASAESVTGTSVDSASDVFISCVITGVGGFALIVVSDSTGAPVQGESINAVDTLGCGNVDQVVYLNDFTVEPGGWLTPVFPSQATPAGGLNFTVIYQGRTYNFSAAVSPIGSECVTLHVPSGKVTTTTVANGEGSYCWQ